MTLPLGRDNLFKVKEEIEESFVTEKHRNKKRRGRSPIESLLFLSDNDSEPDYSEYNGDIESKETTWENIRTVDTVDFEKVNTNLPIKPDEKVTYSYTNEVHGYENESRLIIALGIKYALTGELPKYYTPFLLVNIVLEAAVYCHFSGFGSLEKLSADLLRIRTFVHPWSDWFETSPKYFRKALFDKKYIIQVWCRGPFATEEKDIPIAFRHRPWNRYFRETVPPYIRLREADINYEGNPRFRKGYLQNGEIRVVQPGGHSEIHIVRAQKVRKVFSNAEEYNDWNERTQHQWRKYTYDENPT